jgi:hypothetical protein
MADPNHTGSTMSNLVAILCIESVMKRNDEFTGFRVIGRRR